MTLPCSGWYESRDEPAFRSKTAEVMPTASWRLRARERSAGLPYTASYPSALAAPVAPIADERGPNPSTSSGDASPLPPARQSGAPAASAVKVRRDRGMSRTQGRSARRPRASPASRTSAERRQRRHHREAKPHQRRREQHPERRVLARRAHELLPVG